MEFVGKYWGSETVPFRRFPLAESGVGARSFAGDPEGCCVERAWHVLAAAGGPVVLVRAVEKPGILKQAL